MGLLSNYSWNKTMQIQEISMIDIQRWGEDAERWKKEDTRRVTWQKIPCDIDSVRKRPSIRLEIQ